MHGKRPLKIGILTNIPTPYRKSMWEAYAKIPSTVFDVYYCAPIESDRKWVVPKAEGVREIFLKGKTFGKSAHLNLGIIKLARKYDVWLIGGYSMPTAQLLIILCKTFKMPYVVMFDGISPLKLKMRENLLKLAWKRFLVRGCSAWLGNGTVGRLYAKKLGITDDKIYNQYLTVDVDHFRSLLPDRKRIRQNKREELGIPEEAYVILYVGKLVKDKGVEDLIAAFKAVAAENEISYLLIVGHGDYEEELKRVSAKHPRIIFTGNIEYERIHEAYFASDLFVLPTYHDAWGLVINEALACDLPVITTTAAGASLDLLNTGFVIDPGKPQKLQRVLGEAIENHINIEMNNCIDQWTLRESMKTVESILSNLV